MRAYLQLLALLLACGPILSTAMKPQDGRTQGRHLLADQSQLIATHSGCWPCGNFLVIT
jgi:hypothetical protein